MARGERTIRIKFDGSVEGLRRAAKAAERDIDKVQDKVRRATEDVGRQGAVASEAFTAGIVRGFLALPPQVQAALAVTAAAITTTLLPAIGAAVSAGVLLGIGGGVIAAGIFAAAKNPKVAAAWTKFADRAKAALKGFAEPFIEPLSKAADTLAGAVERISPELNRLAVQLAPLIGPLAVALAQFAEHAMPGIAAAAIASKPLFDVLVEHGPKLGEAVSRFFGAVAIGAPGAARFLDDLLTALERTIVTMGVMFAILSNLYLKISNIVILTRRGIENAWNAIVDFFAKLPGRIGAAASGMWDGIRNAFKSAINWIIDKWNDLQFTISGPGPLGFLKYTLDTPNLPKLHSGGIVPGPLGREVPILARAGERVLTREQQETWSGSIIVENHIEIGGEVVRVIRTVISERDRGAKRRVLAGAGAR